MSLEQSPKTLLVVEDDIGLQSQLRWHFEDYDVIIAGDRESAIAAIRKYEPAVVVQDLGLPPCEDGVEEGFNTLQETLKLAPHTKVIVMTGSNDSTHALRAVASGAYDFYQKPINTDTLDLIVQRAYQMHSLELKNRELQQQAPPLAGIIASSSNMLDICRTLEKLGPSDVTCLLRGESGTGKEVLAKAIHELSPRKSGRFVAINCAAIPENLIESELFGHEKGAFTGANKRTLGQVELADGGTLFLDEIGDMPINLQAKMLRFLQERVIQRVGGRSDIKVDIRVVCATNRNLEAMAANEEFREDLYFRISEMEINIPPLRDRDGDKTLLARHLLQRYVKQQDRAAVSFSKEAIAAIESYNWPGNVRELENRVKRSLVMCDGKYISSTDLGLNEASDIFINLKQVRTDAERKAINQALTISEGNMAAAAKLLGVTRPTLYDLVKKHQIKIKQSVE